MILPETYFHLDHLPPIDQQFIDEAHNAVYQWPAQDHIPNEPVITNSRIPGQKLYRGIAIPTDTCTQYGLPAAGERHTSTSKTVYAHSNFSNTKFGKDVQSALGRIGSRYLYNMPWSLYDWHQDQGEHECAINFLLTDAPGARTMHRFPTDCLLNYKVAVMDYKLYKPVLMKSKVDHSVINLTDVHRYILTVVLLDTTYNVAKEWLLNYKLDNNSYL
jgi:hypothetical protein